MIFGTPKLCMALTDLIITGIDSEARPRYAKPSKFYELMNTGTDAPTAGQQGADWIACIVILQLKFGHLIPKNICA